jgi:hypothetical protein
MLKALEYVALYQKIYITELLKSSLITAERAYLAANDHLFLFQDRSAATAISG